ncbi:MAG: DUF4389 domain-containing protein [Alphaproteobacteria bacterium]|nr:DUF4389 domain-containing protein [Rhodospirillales bacterium]MCW9045534.1 DUF4389 domain-containing protein [Alphaproteobacteria bacterium]
MSETEQSDNNKEEISVWLRGLYLILFAIIFNIVEFIIAFIAIVQLIYKLATKTTNDKLAELGKSLGLYIRAIVDFITFASNDLPYPLGPWIEAEQEPVAFKREAPSSPEPEVVKPETGKTQVADAHKQVIVSETIVLPDETTTEVEEKKEEKPKPAPRKRTSATKKPAAKKTATRKTPAKKPAAKKTATKKTAAKKPTAKPSKPAESKPKTEEASDT